MDDEEKAVKRFYIVKDIFPSVLVVSKNFYFKLINNFICNKIKLDYN